MAILIALINAIIREGKQRIAEGAAAGGGRKGRGEIRRDSRRSNGEKRIVSLFELVHGDRGLVFPFESRGHNSSEARSVRPVMHETLSPYYIRWLTRTFTPRTRSNESTITRLTVRINLVSSRRGARPARRFISRRCAYVTRFRRKYGT